MKNIKYISSALVGLALVACSEEFVDLKPIAKASESTFYTTMTAADQSVTACYANFCMEKLWDLSIMMTLGSIASDEAEAGADGKADVVEYQHIDQLRHTPQEANVFDWSWGYLFKSINYCNIAIQRLPDITIESDPAFDAELIKKRMGEAYFLRAYNYFTLCQIYGGVPIYDKIPTPDQYNKPRNEISEVYALIKADLIKASESLPEREGWGADVGRASKGAANAMLAKVYLYESSYAKYCKDDDRFKGMVEHWDSAAFYAEKVINSGQYKLVGIDGEQFDTWRGPKTGGYQYIFMKDGNNSKESVFEIQNVQDGLEWFNTRGTALVRWTAPRKIDMNTKPNTNGEDFGWGWWCPAQALVNAYEVGDPRFKATVLSEGDSIQCNFPGDKGIAWRKVNFNLLKSATGLSTNLRKYECSYDEYWKNSKSWQDGPINVKLIRFADVVLFASEAYFEMGNNSKSIEYINMVRTRARMSGSTNSPADLSAVSHDAIVHERMVELGCEGHRFFDLVRWNLADKYMNHTLADGDNIEFVKGKHEFFPIPDKQVGLSNGVLQQYPGW